MFQLTITRTHALLVSALLLITCSALSLSAASNAYPPSSKPMLGINMSPVPINVQKREGITPDQGVLVRRTFPNTAAKNMGVRPGDVILSIDGVDIDSMSTLRRIVSGSYSGNGVAVTVSRNGQLMNLNGTYAEWPSDIPQVKLDEKAEREYRKQQQRRLAREQKHATQNDQPLPSSTGPSTPAPSKKAQHPKRQPTSALQQALQDDIGHIPTAIPDFEIPMMASFLPTWEISYDMHVHHPASDKNNCPAEQPETTVDLQNIQKDTPQQKTTSTSTAINSTHTAPDFLISFSVSTTPESM